MLKIVPDPPHSHPFLEDTLVQTHEHVLCAQAIVQHVIPLIFKSPGSMLVLAVLHEIETVRTQLESALAQIQLTVHPQTLH